MNAGEFQGEKGLQYIVVQHKEACGKSKMLASRELPTLDFETSLPKKYAVFLRQIAQIPDEREKKLVQKIQFLLGRPIQRGAIDQGEQIFASFDAMTRVAMPLVNGLDCTSTKPAFCSRKTNS